MWPVFLKSTKGYVLTIVFQFSNLATRDNAWFTHRITFENITAKQHCTIFSAVKCRGFTDLYICEAKQSLGPGLSDLQSFIAQDSSFMDQNVHILYTENGWFERGINVAVNCTSSCYNPSQHNWEELWNHCRQHNICIYSTHSHQIETMCREALFHVNMMLHFLLHTINKGTF